MSAGSPMAAARAMFLEGSGLNTAVTSAGAVAIVASASSLAACSLERRMPEAELGCEARDLLAHERLDLRYARSLLMASALRTLSNSVLDLSPRGGKSATGSSTN